MTLSRGRMLTPSWPCPTRRRCSRPPPPSAELDPRWRNFLAFGYLAYSGFVQKALDEAYAFRGVDITKVQPVVIR